MIDGKRVKRMLASGRSLGRMLGYAASLAEDKADRFGLIRAILSPLKEAEKVARDDLAELADPAATVTIKGALYCVSVRTHDVDIVDWKALAGELGATAKQIAKHTQTQKRVDVRPTALPADPRLS